MKMTREEAIRNFREHWASLAISGSEDKNEFLRRHGFQYINCSCFLCEYAEENDIRDCDKCPVEWPETNTDMHYKCSRSFYGDWERARTPEERKHLAAIIRDLPEKKVETESELKIGDWVKVVSIGGCHSSYETFFKENNLKEFADKFKKDCSPIVGDFYRIVAIGKYHGESEACYGPLYVIESCDGQAYIVNNDKKGMELITSLKPRFSVGDKVVPISKSVCGPLSASMGWKRARGKGQPFLYVTMVGSNIVCHEKPTLNNGDYFLESDLRPYVEPLKSKFEVGDIVAGNAESNKEYNFTNSEMVKGKIIGIPQDGIIAVKILEHKEKHWNGCIFSALEEKYFDLVTDGPKPQKEYPKELQAEWVGGKPEFKVGDRVRVNTHHCYHSGVIGKIIGLKRDEPYRCFPADDGLFAVETNAPFNNVSGDWEANHPDKKGRGFYIRAEYIELLPHNLCPEDKTITVQTITVKFKGPETICTIKNQFGTFKGRAKCHPTDQWNEKTGADLALGRAVEKFNEYEPDA